MATPIPDWIIAIRCDLTGRTVVAASLWICTNFTQTCDFAIFQLLFRHF
jgi:hypothetical protein